MAWVIKNRSWILAGGLVLVLLGREPSGSETDVRSVLYGVGYLLVFLAVLGILLAIPMALRARREAHQRPISN